MKLGFIVYFFEFASREKRVKKRGKTRKHEFAFGI